MRHDEAEALLGAYALDAVAAAEAEQLELHLRDCPRCRAELATHREVAGALGNFDATVPDTLWEKIAQRLDGDGEGGVARPLPPLGNLTSPVAKRWRPLRPLLAGVAAIAAAALVLLGISVGHLNSELNGLQRSAVTGGLASAVAATALGAHQEVTLTATGSTNDAKIEIAPNGTAYWTGASLASLNAQQSYQLWAQVGQAIVSLGLIGANPRDYFEFNVAPTMTALMVTVEPAGGTAQPTTPVVVRGKLPSLA